MNMPKDQRQKVPHTNKTPTSIFRVESVDNHNMNRHPLPWEKEEQIDRKKLKFISIMRFGGPS